MCVYKMRQQDSQRHHPYFLNRSGDASVVQLPPLFPLLRVCAAANPVATTNASEKQRTMPRTGGDRRKTRSRSVAVKLPKMNNSERGKYYRQKYKAFEDELEAAVATLTKEVRDLKLLKRLRDELLAAQYAPSTVSRVFQIVEQAQTGELPLRLPLSPPASVSPTASIPVSRFELHDLHVLDSSTPMIALGGDVLTQRRSDDREVRYPATLRLYFDADGELQSREVETDVVRGLRSVLPSLSEVNEALGLSCFAEHDPTAEMAQAAPMALAFILNGCDTHPAARS